MLSDVAIAWMMGAAQPASSGVIEWTAPATCPDDAVLEARIATLVDIAAASSPTQATVRDTGTQFEVELVSTIDGEIQQRMLSAPTCETLADAVAVVVALTIDPQAATPVVDVDERVPPPPVHDPTTRETGVPLEPPIATPRERRPLEITLRGNGGYGSGLAPIGSGLIGLAIALGRRPWTIELEGRLWIPRTFDAPDGSFGARVILGTAVIAGCLRPPTRAVEIPICAGIEAGAQRVTPLRLLEGSTRSYPWVAPLLRLGLRLRLAERVGLLLIAEGAVPLVRAGIDVDGADRLWETRTVSGRALVGLDVRWIR